MKSTHEPFDEEVKRRLLNYTEEPEKDLWQDVVQRIVSVNPEPRWIVWNTRLSVLIIAISGAYFVFTGEDAITFEGRISQNNMPMPHRFNSPAIDTLEVRVPSGARDRSVSNHVIQNERAFSLRNGASPEIPQAQLKMLLSDVPVENENVFVPVKTDPSFMGHENIEIVSTTNPSESATSQNPAKETSLRKDPAKREESGASKETDKKKKPFSLYFTAMPTFGYQRIESNNADDIFIQGIKRIPAFSPDRLGARLEAGAEVPLSKRWRVFGGFLYFQRQQTIEYVERQTESVIIGSGPETGTPEGQVDAIPRYKYVSKSIEYELKNAGVQVGFTYQLWTAPKNSVIAAGKLPSKGMNIPRKKFLHLLGSGIEFHKALNGTEALERSEHFTDPSTYVFFNLYYRMQYPNAGKLRAVFQPTFNYSFYINENFNAPFYVKPYGLGLNFGCTYNFR